ncbi:hypothetical protein HUT06_02900 [Actinomadura sp. NAK00032]|uniref:hypothetical protein n=1 Tax=Actinomadura sp. NAK00032 TaxID=2742128 RepID=UPI00159201D6|nr:hypothetical protein [Actinomadura sp. NAK00032]QKW33111.1 hypothetical protein HUT06_02900 [Actinomadura sp. NAK00032]
MSRDAQYGSRRRRFNVFPDERTVDELAGLVIGHIRGWSPAMGGADRGTSMMG